MTDLKDRLKRFVARHGGLLPLKPCLVGRGYRGGGRLAGRGPGLVRRRDGKYLVERWIASSTRAGWGDAEKEEGLSDVAGFGPALRLKDAIGCLPEEMLGHKRAVSHEGEFRVLTKILDAFDPIGFHFHQSDHYLQTHRQAFPAERFGKDEAYYFLPGPKGSWPYTHVGICPDVTRERLIEALVAGREALLDISPYFLQRAGSGFFVPAGLVHSPGTMLTLEVQQPSDVGGGFGVRRAEGQLPEQELAAAEAVLEQVDLTICSDPDLVNRNTLLPVAIASEPGMQQWWIMDPRVTRRFGARRVVCTGPCGWREEECFALLVWSGEGKINGRAVTAGQELFVPYETARVGLDMDPGPGGLEMYSIFAEALQ